MLTSVWAYIESIPGPYLAMVFMGMFGLTIWTLNKLDDRKKRRQSHSVEHEQAAGQPTARVQHRAGNLIVHYAGYGLGWEQYRDVTNRVRSFMDDGTLHVRVGHESLQCAPYHGKIKHLRVIYSYQKSEGASVQAEDEQLLELP
jgi:hypothetical protein